MVLVDKLPEGQNTSRAAAVNARTLEVLEDLDVARRMVKAGLIAPRFTMREGRRMLIPVDFSDLPTKHPYTLMLSQADTERLLLERLHEYGGEVIRPKTLSRVTRMQAVHSHLRRWRNRQARYIVSTDGCAAQFANKPDRLRRSRIRRVPCPRQRTAGRSGARDEVIFFYAKEGLNVLAPLPGDIFRIVAPATDVPQVPSAAFVQSLLDTRAFGPGRASGHRTAVGNAVHLHHRVADSYRAGRILLARDAAHVHSPAGGQGMNLGITDAISLANALSEVLGGGSDTALDAYGTAQRRRAEQVLKLTGRLTRIATLPRPLRPIRNSGMRLAARVPAVRRQLALQLSGLSHR